MGLPVWLNAMELAVCRIRAASRGSAPISVTVRSGVFLGSASSARIRNTMSGKHGKSTFPVDSSRARLVRNSSPDSLADSGDEHPAPEADFARLVGASAAFFILLLQS